MAYQPTYSNPILKKGVMTLKSVVFTGARASKYKTILIRASSVEAIAHAAQYVMEAHEKLYPMPLFGKGPQRRTVQSPPRSRYSDSEAAMQEFHLLAKERRCVRELEVYGQLSYAAAASPVSVHSHSATYASTVQPQFRNNDAELMEEPWYLQMNQIARIFDETEINAACQLSFITKSRQEFKFLCDSSSSYRHWIQLLDECFDECHPFEGLSNLYDLRGRRPSYGDSESSTYSSLPTHSPVRSSSAASGGSKVPSWNASMDSKNQEKKYSSDKWSMGKAATKSFVSTPPHPPPALASRSFSSPSGHCMLRLTGIRSDLTRWNEGAKFQTFRPQLCQGLKRKGGNR
ncbi:hypothetical protein BCR33DRAFT_779506 [Rhizoclosmatium globosum]|uniref:Uncharacterized protein n=1 Tax=Rhizoclosmatium globosum TaxID=329046 RepID=A0A1Y2D1M1_9FUNG|nr:hypothetical protein BCR33DRAFT_779506 [Rhizoclosmatium globosum]|eukprot:ORY53182.1 hypothetical protein BCR33DRAFT_779506 [Rhizoclosmatium globosum]